MTSSSVDPAPRLNALHCACRRSNAAAPATGISDIDTTHGRLIRRGQQQHPQGDAVDPFRLDDPDLPIDEPIHYPRTSNISGGGDGAAQALSFWPMPDECSDEPRRLPPPIRRYSLADLFVWAVMGGLAGAAFAIGMHLIWYGAHLASKLPPVSP